MDTKKVIKVPVIIAIVALFLPIIIGDMDIGYYTLLRLIVCGVGAYLSYVSFNVKKQVWMWTFCLIALLFNPFIPIHLEETTWHPIDIITGLTFLVSIFTLDKHIAWNKFFRSRGFRNTALSLLAVFILCIILCVISSKIERDKEQRLEQSQPTPQRYDILASNPVENIVVTVKGEKVTINALGNTSAEDMESLKGSIKEKYFKPILDYKDENIKAQLVNAYSHQYKDTTVVVFEIKFQVVTETKMIYKSFLGSYFDLRDNFENAYMVYDSSSSSEQSFFASDMPDIPASNTLKTEARFGDIGTVYLVSNEPPLEASTMLWLEIPENYFGNENKIVFKMPTSFIGANIQDFIKRKDYLTELQSQIDVELNPVFNSALNDNLESLVNNASKKYNSYEATFVKNKGHKEHYYNGFTLGRNLSVQWLMQYQREHPEFSKYDLMSLSAELSKENSEYQQIYDDIMAIHEENKKNSKKVFDISTAVAVPDSPRG